SAPSGVRVVPSCAASCGETAAMTPVASRDSARALDFNTEMDFMLGFLCQGGSEVHAEAERDEIAIAVGVEMAAKEVGVTEAGGVGVQVVGIHADADCLEAFLEVGAIAL